MTVIFKDLTSFLLQCRSSKSQTPLLLFYQEEIIFKIPQDYFLEFHVDCPVFHMMVLQTLKYKIRIFSSVCVLNLPIGLLLLRSAGRNLVKTIWELNQILTSDHLIQDMCQEPWGSMILVKLLTTVTRGFEKQMTVTSDKWAKF